MLTDYHQALHLWHKTSVGRGVWDTVCKEVATLTCDFFGQRLLVIGSLDIHKWLASCPITSRIYLSDAVVSDRISVGADVHCLPFADDSIDAIIVPYAFEWLLQLDVAMAELGRVLIPQGNILIVGFNPTSLWGLARPWQKDRLPPFDGRMLRMGQIRYLLAKANCVVADMKTCYYGLPLGDASIRNISVFETLGRLGWPSWGGVYVIHGYKQIMPMTPIRPRWPQKVRWADSPALVKPSC